MVELAIVLAISGIVIAGGLLVGTILLESTALKDTQKRIDEVNDAIKAFVEVHKRLPCPASLTKIPGDAGYGFEEMTAPGTCATSGTYRGTAGSEAVTYGAVPVRRLGISDKMMGDAYGNRFIYAMTDSLSSAPNFAAQTASLDDAFDGAINIVDANGNPLSGITMAYALVSTGQDGKGGHRYKTGAAPTTACPIYGAGQNLDRENCDHIVQTDDITLMDARYNRGEVTATYYDDILRFTPKFALTQASLSGVDNLCNASNLNLLRYDEGRERMQICQATGWEDVPLLGTGPDCFASQEDMVRASATSAAALEYCDVMVGSPVGVWTIVPNS